MPNLDENKATGEDKTSQRFIDKRTDDRIRRHLTDEKDSISAEDISNIQSDMTTAQPENNVADDEKVIENKDSIIYDGKDDQDKDKPKDITPWEVID